MDKTDLGIGLAGMSVLFTGFSAIVNFRTHTIGWRRDSELRKNAFIAEMNKLLGDLGIDQEPDFYGYWIRRGVRVKDILENLNELDFQSALSGHHEHTNLTYDLSVALTKMYKDRMIGYVHRLAGGVGLADCFS